MKHLFPLLLFIFTLFGHAYGQNTNMSYDRVTIKLIYGRDTLPGIKILVKDTKICTTSDYQGIAVIEIPKDKNALFVEVLSSYLDLEVIRPVDSIVFNMKSKYAYYYYLNKKMLRKKQPIPDL